MLGSRIRNMNNCFGLHYAFEVSYFVRIDERRKLGTYSIIWSARARIVRDSILDGMASFLRGFPAPIFVEAVDYDLMGEFSTIQARDHLMNILAIS